MRQAILLETKKISKNNIEKIHKQKIFFAYFQSNEKYYLFLLQEEKLNLNFIYSLIDVLKVLDTKIRQIRSLRGFILFTLEIMADDKDYQILDTNLQPFFWTQVKRIINQNRKIELENFLFSKDSYDFMDSIENFDIRTTETDQDPQKFKNFKEIPESAKIEIIETGFKMQKENKISLKNYYESNYDNSLNQMRGFSIKYESIRRTNLYKSLSS